jgi:hypothetical protein
MIAFTEMRFSLKMGALEMKLQEIPPPSGFSDVRESIKSRFPPLPLVRLLNGILEVLRCYCGGNVGDAGVIDVTASSLFGQH